MRYERGRGGGNATIRCWTKVQWQDQSIRRYRHTFALWTILICGLAAPGHAEVHVEGSPVSASVASALSAKGAMPGDE
jgi:hypothetical protein